MKRSSDINWLDEIIINGTDNVWKLDFKTREVHSTSNEINVHKV